MVKVPNVTKVINAGQSSDGQAVQLIALANPAGTATRARHGPDQRLARAITNAHLPPD